MITKVKMRDCILYAEKSDARLVWFQKSPSEIFFFEDIPENSPRWTFGTVSEQKKVLRLANEVFNNGGWKIIINNFFDVAVKFNNFKKSK